MERSSTAPRPPYQPAPRGNLVFKTVIPERKLDESIINKLFLLASEGDYMKLKEYMASNNIALSVKNDKSESILHIIIKNNNLSQRDKLQLIKLSVANGAQINSFDINNVTPLHLAAKYQHDDIITYLLSVGANIEAKDSQYKTPLFYAVNGNSVQCPAPNEEKVKPLIPLNEKQIREHIMRVTAKKQQVENISSLYPSMVKHLKDDAFTNVYMQHIDNTLTIVPDMFDDIEDFVDEQKHLWQILLLIHLYLMKKKKDKSLTSYRKAKKN